MRVHFLLRYRSQFGEMLFVSGQHAILGSGNINAALPLTYLNQDFWQVSLEIPLTKTPIAYHFVLRSADGILQPEGEKSRIFEANSDQNLVLVDTWNSFSDVNNAWETQPFKAVLMSQPIVLPQSVKKSFTGKHIFRIKAPQLLPNESPVLIGSSIGLGNWLEGAAVPMLRQGDWWECQVEMQSDTFPIAYKYALRLENATVLHDYESGDNRMLYDTQTTSNSTTILHEGFMRLKRSPWRGAGVAIPVFSLKSANSFGVGEFADIPALVQWGSAVGLKLIQLLPINDTSATGLFTDSYPYASISVFALHPIYINLAQVAGAKHKSILTAFETEKLRLNGLPVVDYVAVLAQKWQALRLLFAASKKSFLADPAYKHYFEQNQHWLKAYSVFCFNRDRFGSSEYANWPEMAVCDLQALHVFFEAKHPHYDEIQLHCFVQYHLHLQLLAATQFAHQHKMVLKGDIAIGIYRHSCDAWVAPELYNMEWQAGAPPDDFAAEGQNWGFPTYNWTHMKADGFQWWRQRFEQLSYYFDAFRIDHILGFFRIWSIPLDAVQGILGRFVPAIPVNVSELYSRGIGFDVHRFCKPYITVGLLNTWFGYEAQEVRDTFLQSRQDGRFDFKPEFDTQRKLESYFALQPDPHDELRDKLYGLIANIIFIADNENPEAYHFRIGMEKTTSFRDLSAQSKGVMQQLYLNYFYKRQDDFWEREAYEKLPALKAATNMLICGEDLGMVPACVPDVMTGLGILSLEIQRMPKDSTTRFFHPKTAPYLSVVTPSTHDMSTIRGWWEEDRNQTQLFYNAELGQPGLAPYFCEAWVNRKILDQHFYSPAMWAIFQLQDLMGMDAILRRENPNEERINQPANPKHYWQYRMHLSLETLQNETNFNQELARLVKDSGR